MASVYCGRGKGGQVNETPGQYGWLGNPVAIGRTCPICGSTHNDAGSTLPCYRRYLHGRLQEPAFEKEFRKLIGRETDLWCFCLNKPGGAETCHTSIMKRALAWLAAR